MKHEPTVEELLQRLLHGESEGERREEVVSELAVRAAADPGLAARIAEELRFSELLRQILADEGDAGMRFEATLEGASREDGELRALVREGEASAAECDRLVKALWNSPDDIHAFRLELAEDEWLREAVSDSKSGDAFIEALETRMWAETRSDHFVEDFAKRLERELVPASGAEVGEGKIVPFPRSRARSVVAMGAVAATLAFGAFVATQIAVDRMGGRIAPAKVVKTSGDADWSGGEAPGRDGSLRSGLYHLNSGVVSLRMFSGSEMTLEGPAVFEVGHASTFVHSGIALARVPETDKAISIRSRGLSVAEPARLIGIDARATDATEAIVFSGDGGICLTEGGICRELSRLESVKADHARERLVDIPYNPRAFSRAWELLSGVEDNLGSVTIQLPGSEISTARGEQGEVKVFVENESFRPEGDLEVDRIVVGEFASAEANPGQQLQAKGELRSYLLQLWPPDEQGGGERETSLTFDHPVVGVIFSSNRLESSDLSVGSPFVQSEAVDRPKRGMESGNDEILLSLDRRTLNLRIKGGGEQVEQVRVLVALN